MSDDMTLSCAWYHCSIAWSKMVCVPGVCVSASVSAQENWTEIMHWYEADCCLSLRTQESREPFVHHSLRLPLPLYELYGNQMIYTRPKELEWGREAAWATLSLSRLWVVDLLQGRIRGCWAPLVSEEQGPGTPICPGSRKLAQALLAAHSTPLALLPHLPFIPADLAPVLTQHD